jgi:hypothetical protein
MAIDPTLSPGSRSQQHRTYACGDRAKIFFLLRLEKWALLLPQ